MNTTLFKHVIFLFLAIALNIQIQAQNKAKYDLNKIREFIPENLDSAMYYSKNLLNYENSNSDSLLAISHYFQGIIDYYKGHYYISTEHYKKAIQSEFANQNLRFKGKIHNNLGVNYDMTDQYELALEEYKKSIKADQEFNDLNGVAQSNLNIGLVYFNLKQYDDGLVYIEEALEYFQKEKYHQGMGLCYHNIGMLYLEKKEYEKALDYLLNANSEYLTSGDSYERGVNLNNLVRCAKELGYTNDAHQFLKESKQLALENDYDYLMELSLLSEAELYIEDGLFEKASSIISKIEPTNIKTVLRKSQIQLQIDIANTKLNNLDEILYDYKELMDSVNNYQTHQLIHELKTQYDKEIASLNLELISSEKEKSNQFFIFSVIITLLLILSIYLFFIRKRH